MEVVILSTDIKTIDWLAEQLGKMPKSEERHSAETFLHRIKTNTLSSMKLKNK